MKVYFSREAEEDLNDIFIYIEEHDGVSRALTILDQLQEKCMSLKKFAHRGHVPPELKRIHVDDILEVSSPPYRIIYEISDEEVHIGIVCDGRREITDLLQKRLFRF